jgi:hypothetical protein
MKCGRRVRTESLGDEWTIECQDAFDKLKNKMIQHPVLILPNPKLPYVIMSDSSKVAMGAVLMQRLEDGLHPVAFYSKKFSSAELNYGVHEQELLALFMSLKHWRHLLLGSHITIYTDHKPLQYLKTQPILSPRQYRWLTYFADYDTEIIAIPGTKNVVADALSRYSFDDAFTNSVDALRVKFLNKIITEPANMSAIYRRYGYDKLSSISPYSILSSIDDITEAMPSINSVITNVIDNIVTNNANNLNNLNISNNCTDGNNRAIVLHNSGSNNVHTDDDYRAGTVDIKNSLINSYNYDVIAKSLLFTTKSKQVNPYTFA